MGVVYLATDLRLDRPVALKLIAPEFAEDEHFRRRFLNEPRLAASVDHPSVIPIYEAGEHDGPAVPGDALRRGKRPRQRAPARGDADAGARAADPRPDRRRARRRPPARPRAPRRQAGERAARRGRAPVPDRLRHHQAARAAPPPRPATRSARSTTWRRSRSAARPSTGAADAYALACVLYECLAGTPRSAARREAETMWAHLQEEPPPLRGHPALDPVLRRALAKDQDERHATCARADPSGAPRRSALGGRRIAARRRRALARGRRCSCSARRSPRSPRCARRATGASPAAAPVGNGVAAIDAASGTGRRVHRVRRARRATSRSAKAPCGC